MMHKLIYAIAFSVIGFAASLGYAQNFLQKKIKTSVWKVEVKPADGDKYLIEGSVFAIGDPVHETLTLAALINGGVVRSGTTIVDRSVADYIRGVFWNDDPCALLLSGNPFSPLQPSYGWVWYVEFKKGQRQAKNGAGTYGIVCPLLGRSHFGDLQFLHGMARENGVKAVETANRMLGWANFTYRLAIGEIDPLWPLANYPMAKALLNSEAQKNARQLFLAKTSEETRARALGSLLHMIQDSYAHGHVTRVDKSAGKRAGIIQFLTYLNQDSDKHAHDDSWRDGNNDVERTLNIPGAKAALAASTRLIKLYNAKTPWPVVLDFLKNGPLFLRADAMDSGAGRYR